MKEKKNPSVGPGPHGRCTYVVRRHGTVSIRRPTRGDRAATTTTSLFTRSLIFNSIYISNPFFTLFFPARGRRIRLRSRSSARRRPFFASGWPSFRHLENATTAVVRVDVTRAKTSGETTIFPEQVSDVF